MKNKTIGFIGAGNMASALIGGLVADGYAADKIWVSDLDEKKCQQLQEHFKIRIAADNNAVARDSDVLVLAVKPQVMKTVCMDLRNALTPAKTVLLSVAAGIKTDTIGGWCGEQCAIIRAMPNTPALVQAGATALYANKNTSGAQRDLAENIVRAVGVAVWVGQESHMDIVTALSGSGPAYFFLVMEVMQKAAIALGLPTEQARLLTLQTALGAARLAMEADDDVAVLRQRVTSPGGTTEQAIKTFVEGNIESLFADAIKAAANRSQTLSSEFA